MEDQRKEADNPLCKGISKEQVLPSNGIDTADPRAQGHSAHKNGQHQGLSVCSMTKKEFQVMSPDRLINETGKPGQRKYKKKNIKKPSVHLSDIPNYIRQSLNEQF